MNQIEFRSISVSVSCPHCQAVNSLTVADVPDQAKISCSTCHEPLGALGDLRRPPQHETLQTVAAE